MDIKCPITMCIFLDPVLASDGFFYERQAIETWLNKSNKSPVTGVTMNKTIHKCHELKSYVDKYLEKYPHKKAKQYILEEYKIIKREGFYPNESDIRMRIPDGLHIFASNYNILRIMSGMGGLAYSG